jgi:GNAT superfamily N-acetyltransferase
MVAINKHLASKVPSIDILLSESEREGFAFLRRFVKNWQVGENRFDKSDESLFLAVEEGDVIGIGGLNIDPYAEDSQVGRVRHVYVASHFRRRGIGQKMVEQIINQAKQYYRELRLMTDTPEGAIFYESIGFVRLENKSDSSHVMVF